MTSPTSGTGHDEHPEELPASLAAGDAGSGCQRRCRGEDEQVVDRGEGEPEPARSRPSTPHGFSVGANGSSSGPGATSRSANQTSPAAAITCQARRHRAERWWPSGVNAQTEPMATNQRMNEQSATSAAVAAPGGCPGGPAGRRWRTPARRPPGRPTAASSAKHHPTGCRGWRSNREHPTSVAAISAPRYTTPSASTMRRSDRRTAGGGASNIGRRHDRCDRATAGRCRPRAPSEAQRSPRTRAIAARVIAPGRRPRLGAPSARDRGLPRCRDRQRTVASSGPGAEGTSRRGGGDPDDHDRRAGRPNRPPSG